MIREEEEMWESLGVKAQTLAREGRIDEAMKMVKEIPWSDSLSGWSHEKTLALIAIASQMIEQGQGERARPVLDDAQKCCERLHQGATWEEADCYAAIALLFDRLGLRNDAIAIWRKAVAAAQKNQSGDMDCVKILARIARDLADIGEVQLATKVAHSIDQDVFRARAVDYVLSREKQRRKE